MRVCLAGVGGGGGGHEYVGSPGRREWEGPAAQTGGGTIRKSPWMATVFGAKDGRLANGATIESPTSERGSQGREMLVDERAEGAALAKERPWSLTRCPATYRGARRGCRLDGNTPEGIPPYLEE